MSKIVSDIINKTSIIVLHCLQTLLSIICHMPFSKNHIGSLFSYHDARCICIACDYGWHDWSIGNSESFHSINFQFVVHNRPRIMSWSHLASSHIMIVWVCKMPDDAFPVWISERLVRFWTERIWLVVKFGTQPLQRRKISNFHAHFNPLNECCNVKWIIKEVRPNDWIVKWICWT